MPTWSSAEGSSAPAALASARIDSALSSWPRSAWRPARSMYGSGRVGSLSITFRNVAIASSLFFWSRSTLPSPMPEHGVAPCCLGSRSAAGSRVDSRPRLRVLRLAGEHLPEKGLRARESGIELGGLEERCDRLVLVLEHRVTVTLEIERLA